MLESVVMKDGKVDKVLVKMIPNHKEKVKGVIHWVSKEHSLNVRVNMY